jgi:archaellum component FlaC
MKTALARIYTGPGRSDMAPIDNTELATQVAELRSDVRHIQSDVRDLRDSVDKRFDAVDKRFDGVDKRFDGVDKKLERFGEKFEEIKDSLASAKLWAFGLYIALAGTLLYVVARSAKWI